ncbi:MAG: CoA transferase [Rhodospirillales bacterium]|nr:CoA transferase [Rhodospirillales bacterium]
MAGPLDGVRVIDLTSMISGPLATLTLADQGADVIKVEPPSGGDFSRKVATRRNGFSASFVNNNRNKRSLVLDLKNPHGLAAFRKLTDNADVVIQNFRPGVAERIGVGEDALRKTNPSLIYVSISGFGFAGPYAQKPVFDPLIQALTGLTTVQAGADHLRPRLIRTILPDKLTGIQAAQAITAALFARERSGQGQHIRLSMLDTIVAFLWSSDMGGHTFVGDETDIESAQSFIDLIYETADGYISVAAMHDKHWQSLSKALERPDFMTDPRFTTPELREINKEARLELTQVCIKPHTTAALLDVLEAEGVPCAPVLTRSEMRAHPQIIANEILFQSDHPHAGRLRQARQPAVFSKTINEMRHPAPMLGGQTREILHEAGFTDGEIAELLASHAAVQADTESR